MVQSSPRTLNPDRVDGLDLNSAAAPPAPPAPPTPPPCSAARSPRDPGSYNASYEGKKVVRDSGTNNELATDYLPRERNNMNRSINLIFSTPGYSLGGAAVDHFPAGTKFQRSDVPTKAGPPSIDVDLWEQDPNQDNRYVKPAGTMKFVYGYIVAKTGTKRNGWIAYDALTASTGCK